MLKPLSLPVMLACLLGLPGCQSVGLFADNHASKIELADQAYQNQQYNQAYLQYSSLADDFPESSFIQLRLGNSAYHLQHWEAAATHYTLASELDITDPRALYNLMQVRLEQASQLSAEGHRQFSGYREYRAAFEHYYNGIQVIGESQ